MGSTCCSCAEVDPNDLNTKDSYSKPSNTSLQITERQLIALIKIQKNFKGYLTRKKVQLFKTTKVNNQRSEHQVQASALVGDFQNTNVRLKRQELGEFKYTDKDFQTKQDDLESRQTELLSNGA